MNWSNNVIAISVNQTPIAPIANAANMNSGNPGHLRRLLLPETKVHLTVKKMQRTRPKPKRVLYPRYHDMP